MKKNYNIYLTFGSIPLLYAQTNIFLDKSPSYIWYYRDNFFNINDKNVSDNLKYYHKINGFDYNYMKFEYKDIIKKLKEIKNNDEGALFTVFIDDSRVQFYLKPFLLSGFFNDINKIVIISEGNITQYMYSEIGKYSIQEQKKEWDLLINQIIENSNKADESLMKIKNYSFYLSTKKNVEYIMPYHELLNNPRIPKVYRDKMNISNLNLEKMYDLLTTNQKSVLHGNVLDDIIQSINKVNKYVIIIGTYDFGDKDITTFIYENLIDQVLIDYGDKYDFLFKAHPLFPVSDNKEFEKYLNNHNITILPERIPLELLLWTKKNIFVGGFCSTINSMIKPSRTKFFFGEKIGYVKLMDKNNMFDASIYNGMLSQKLAQKLIEYNNKKSAEVVEISNVLRKNFNSKLGELESRIITLEHYIKKESFLSKIRNIFKR